MRTTEAHQAETSFHWHEEDETHKLGDLLDLAVARVEQMSGALLFTVDDALWVDDFQADSALQILKANSKVYAVHAKLCPRIEYAHPNDKYMRVPPLSHAGAGSDGKKSRQSEDLGVI